VTLGRFALVVLAVVTLSVTLLFVVGLEAPTRAAALYGTAVAMLNAVAAFGVMRWAEGRPAGAFLAAVLGGMGVRMIGVLVAVLLAVTVFDLPRLALVASLFGHFVVFLVLEMVAVGGRRAALAGAR
jgi:hypothetical protein